MMEYPEPEAREVFDGLWEEKWDIAQLLSRYGLCMPARADHGIKS